MIKTRNDALRELGFEPNSEPNKDAIKRNYRKKALQVHPDKNPSQSANDKFVILNDAYEFLSQDRQFNSAIPDSAASSSSSSKPSSSSTSPKRHDKRQSTPPYRIKINIKKRTFTTYKMLFSDQPNLAKQFKKNITSFVMHADEKNLLPENIAAIIIDELLKQNSLTLASFPSGFLSDEQNFILQKKIKQNIDTQNSKKLDLENREKLSHHRWTVMGVILAISAAALAGQGYGLIFYYGALGGVISYHLKELHNRVGRWHYQNKKSIEASSPAEKAALKLGVEAITWPGYFTSFLHWQAYRHPQAFVTGMKHAEQENEKLVKAIRTLPQR
jgi:hypothetical protein